MKDTEPKVTLAQIAQKAGVSISTVSRVFNREAGVAPATVRAVESVLDSFAYAPPAVRTGPKQMFRRGIRNGRVVFLSLHPEPPEKLYQLPAFPLLLGGIQKEVMRQGLDLVLAHTPGGKWVPPVLARNQADGVLLFGIEKMSASLKKVLARIPVVCCLHVSADPQHEFDHVYYDNSHVGQIAADYLIDSGHQHLAFFNIWPDGYPFQHRGQQFIKAAHRRGVRSTVIEPSSNTPSGQHLDIYKILTKELLAVTPLPSGIFIPADNMMVRAFNMLQKHGFNPSQDLELIGCNNDPAYLEQLHPRPATIDIRLQTVGERAIRQLLRRMAHPEEEGRTEIAIPPLLMPGEDFQSRRTAEEEQGAVDQHVAVENQIVSTI